MNLKRKKALLFLWRGILVVLVNVMIFAMLSTGTSRALSKYGSTGGEVAQIQQRLQELGFKPGKAGGLYGCPF